jgi:hypothetical protein
MKSMICCRALVELFFLTSSAPPQNINISYFIDQSLQMNSGQCLEIAIIYLLVFVIFYFKSWQEKE